MALKGNLRDFSATQLLNLINLASKTGTLIVERPGEQVMACFRAGKLAYAKARQEDNSLGAVLHRANRLSAPQLLAIQQHASHMSDKALGLLLINARSISQQDILDCLQAYYTGILTRLFDWADGAYHFENDLPPPDGKITVLVSLENIIIDGARRMKEQARLQEEIPSLDLALKFADRPGANIRELKLSVDEWRVVSYINPKNTIRQIARTTRLTDAQIRRTVYTLLEAGLVEIIRPLAVTAPVAPLPVPAPVVKDKAEQKSLINRLINRIRRL